MNAAANNASPVLIVGAGPTGLAAAMSLARAHIPVRLIDRAMQPNPYSRAIGIQARTLELLEQHRLAERFLELGHRARVANLFSNGMRLAQLDFDPLHTRYPYLLFLDQSVTERLLTEHLATLGVTIERGVELTMFSQGSVGVQATLRRADGHTETLRPSYMIAADGAHSAIRHGLGLNFVGKTSEQTFLLADVHAETDWPDDEFHIFASGEGLVALFPMGHGRHRLIADHAVEPTPAAAAPLSPVVLGEPPLARVRAPSLDECKALVARRVHERVDVSELAWSSYFHVNSRMVERLRVGRVFLAGDAAHVHSPAGAQGMNTGIQEAFNLGWKLARVLKGAAPDRLLDTYHIERHPIERDVLRQTGFITQMAEADHGPLKLLRERVMPVLAALGPLRDAARLTISELSIQYRRSPLTLERVLDGGPRAGERAPDAVVHVVDGPLGRAPGIGCIYDLHDPAFFSLFLLVPPLPADDKPLDPDAKHAPPADAELERLTADMEKLLEGAVRIWRVTDTSGDGGPSLAESYGRTRPSFYLLRPDGYISARGRTGSDLNGLLRHCEAWFTVDGQIPEQTAV
ncbi:FAD-dependent monooxygenase [Paraburkholderia sp. SIMBA_055]|jgi:2-polyprenyl-6-methoxyphenol hydroxylase-like FAD-dependent oxidoreductase|uniref:Monooxygenase FAD-binding n=2 Tax=Burkholderiaceae TaxID=119060 RepID=B1G2M1_PARG4|nr:FAD-dependent monooxygenase [Paraburkholderia graminis]AXF08817.1 FAD-binding monooxygenase [Paraburkholderia graminis]EDT09651.1 monooxygenase FAD-binding [Paraburkholderia graminis C4D1M]MDR6467749.1 2-polyprenyl-6-methoxyphenol hydroxylase-like FAD-dependent oxidoreductase [Paraburkholderia graminis]CAB3687913.1 6-methylpretetramide 4-monooxygenase [Paraburkholderia graminis C4D1M]